MDKARANSAWRMMTFVAEVTREDVDNVYFRGRAPDTRYHDHGPGNLHLPRCMSNKAS